MTTYQPLSPRCIAIARQFGFSRSPVHSADPFAHLPQTATDLLGSIKPPQLILLRGPSGSGKSRLLSELAAQLGPGAVCGNTAPLPDRPVIDCLHEMSIEATLRLLGRFGLGEPRTYLLPANLLSAGERFRLQLARAFARAQRLSRRRALTLLLVDEFATQLDRVSACIIARNLRRCLDQRERFAVVLASCHDDLARWLRPDRIIACDFGRYALQEPSHPNRSAA